MYEDMQDTAETLSIRPHILGLFHVFFVTHGGKAGKFDYE
jgi:hypothetical protein